MIRKAIIVVLTLAAVGVVIIAAVSDTGHVRTPLWKVGNWRFCLYARDTIASVFWFKQHEPMTLDFRTAEWGDTLLFDAASGANYDKLYYRNCELLGSTRVRNRKNYVPYHGISTAYLIARGMRRPAVTVTAIRSSMWTLLALLLAYPAPTLIRALYGLYRRRREWRLHRRGLCYKCGYDLTGDESGVCPECGTDVINK